MFTFLRNVKKAAYFFSVNPGGLSFLTEQRLREIEASVNRLPKAIEDRTLTSIINLEYEVYELKQTIKDLGDKFDKEQLRLKLNQVKTSSKRKPIKLKAVEEEVKKVKSKLTQNMVKRLFEYRDGELYWKVDKGYKVKKGDKAGYCTKKQKIIEVNNRTYTFARIVFLIFHNYLPQNVSFIDGNPFNTKIENLRASTTSQRNCTKKKPKTNTSGYKGVFFIKKTGKCAARIGKLGKRYNLGTFDTPQEAHKAYCKAAKKLHGEFARVV